MGTKKGCRPIMGKPVEGVSTHHGEAITTPRPEGEGEGVVFLEPK